MNLEQMEPVQICVPAPLVVYRPWGTDTQINTNISKVRLNTVKVAFDLFVFDLSAGPLQDFSCKNTKKCFIDSDQEQN